MLRSNQEEQIKYFYLDRKFGSGNLRDIGDALDEIDLFLGKMKKIDLINSLVMRMLDLIQTAKSFHIKQRVSCIFRHHSPILLQIHSRDEIAAVLSKCLKGSDQYTRIIAMQMIATLTPLFLKDIAVYHTLLSKIASPINSKSEQKQAIISLTQLLSHSNSLSKLFTKNITYIQHHYRIQLHVLIYLLTYLTIDSHLQTQILENILMLINSTDQAKTKYSKKQVYYYEKLVMNYAANNYRIVALYQSKLNQVLPRIQKGIRKIKSLKYPFMKNAVLHSNENHQLKMQVFIDELYQRKKQGNLLTQYQEQIKNIVLEAINKSVLLVERLLLIYYLEQDCNKVDRQIMSLIQTNQINSNKGFLKRLLTVGLFQSSNLLLNRIQIHQSNFIFLQLYTQFKITDSEQSLQQLLQITSILSQHLFGLLSLWAKINQIFQIKQNIKDNQRDLLALYNDLSENYLSVKQTTDYRQQLQLISIILHYKTGNINELKSRCYYILPSNILHNDSKFWYAYLHKRTILSLFNSQL